MADEAKPWFCPSGNHVMGMVLRNGSGIRQLLLYRHAVNMAPAEKEETAEVEVFAVVEGYMTNVKCDLCGRLRTWVPGEEAIQQLLNRVREMQDGK